MKQIPKRKPKQKPKQIGDKGERGKRGLRKAEPASRLQPSTAPSVPAVNTSRKQQNENLPEPIPPSLLKGAEPVGQTTPPPPSVDPNAIRPAKLMPGGPAIETYPVFPAADQLLIASDGRPDPELKASSALNPVVLNGLTAMNATRPSMTKGDLATVGITAFVKVMAEKVSAVVSGDMSGVEATMAAQVTSMDALFNQLVSRAHQNITAGYMEAGETYMRLAFKAQSQCRATAETLGELKNPRPVFAKNFNAVAGNQQVNQTTGPQQVNNDSAPKPIANQPE